MDEQRAEMRRLLDQLMAQRSALEAEADAIQSELTSPGPNGEPPAGIKDPLVDAEGFPRADIDIFRVRQLRHRLATINYDHKSLMEQMEKLLHRIYALMPLSSESSAQPKSEKEAAVELQSAPVSAPLETAQTEISSSSQSSSVTLIPIAILDEVLTSSPAHLAGVHNGDKLIRFGTVTASTENSMQSIARIVGESVHQSISITVLRGDAALELALTPQPWGGRGLLGCHLTPWRG